MFITSATFHSFTYPFLVYHWAQLTWSAKYNSVHSLLSQGSMSGFKPPILSHIWAFCFFFFFSYLPLPMIARMRFSEYKFGSCSFCSESVSDFTWLTMPSMFTPLMSQIPYPLSLRKTLHSVPQFNLPFLFPFKHPLSISLSVFIGLFIIRTVLSIFKKYSLWSVSKPAM